MRNDDIKSRLQSDIEFIHNGKEAAFCPIGVFVVGYSGEENTFDTIEDAMNAKVFDGKSLIEIWDDVLPQIE